VNSVCLIHPPHPNCTDDRLYPHLGLLYIAANLQSNRIPVEVCDLSGQAVWNIPHADIYGITAYVATMGVTERIAQACRAVNPSCTIVIGGPHASARPKDFPYADHIVIGMGEESMVDIVTGVDDRRIVNGYAPTNHFPYPAFNLINPSSYSMRVAGEASLPILTSRGCPYKCSFCGLNRMHELGCGVHMADPQTILGHIQRVKDEYGINGFVFQDDIFTLDRKRLFKLLDLIKPLNIHFRCHGRAGYDTEETYKRLADAGCEQVCWGIESGSQYILDRMNKQVKVEDNYNVIQWAKRYGINARAFFIIGFPGETADTINETKMFIEQADPDQWFVSNFIPYPGTKVGDNPKEYGITYVSPDTDDYYQVSKDGTGGITIDTEWMSREEFRQAELSFRKWLSTRVMRGPKQSYEEKLP